MTRRSDTSVGRRSGRRDARAANLGRLPDRRIRKRLDETFLRPARSTIRSRSRGGEASRRPTPRTPASSAVGSESRWFSPRGDALPSSAEAVKALDRQNLVPDAITLSCNALADAGDLAQRSDIRLFDGWRRLGATAQSGLARSCARNRHRRLLRRRLSPACRRGSRPSNGASGATRPWWRSPAMSWRTGSRDRDCPSIRPPELLLEREGAEVGPGSCALQSLRLQHGVPALSHCGSGVRRAPCSLRLARGSGFRRRSRQAGRALDQARRSPGRPSGRQGRPAFRSQARLLADRQSRLPSPERHGHDIEPHLARVQEHRRATRLSRSIRSPMSTGSEGCAGMLRGAVDLVLGRASPERALLL